MVQMYRELEPGLGIVWGVVARFARVWLGRSIVCPGAFWFASIVTINVCILFLVWSFLIDGSKSWVFDLLS